jgi:hypothetical protein
MSAHETSPIANDAAGAHSLHRLVRRGRSNATQVGLALCVEWTTWCRNNGWPEEHLLELEGLFWKYRDADGKLKAPNDGTQP